MVSNAQRLIVRRATLRLTAIRCFAFLLTTAWTARLALADYAWNPKIVLQFIKSAVVAVQ